MSAARLSRAAGPEGTTAGGSSATTTGQPRSTSPQAGLPPAATSTASGVRGTVTAGPTCPVQRADSSCPPRPLQVEVVAHDSTGAVTGTTESGADGSYAMSLPPGYYELEVPSQGGATRCAVTEATVEAGKVTRADISCDTGIR